MKLGRLKDALSHRPLYSGVRRRGDDGALVSWKANIFYLLLVIPISLKVLWEFSKYFRDSKSQGWLPFFLWTNLSLIIYLAVPVAATSGLIGWQLRGSHPKEELEYASVRPSELVSDDLSNPCGLCRRFDRARWLRSSDECGPGLSRLAPLLRQL